MDLDVMIIGKQMLVTLAFSTMGIVIFMIAFWLMERLSPFSLRKEIEDDHNTAAAIIMASVIIGISLIIMGAMSG
jgi:uncharacterized membrane protein YjfL (UPF0719 family)